MEEEIRTEEAQEAKTEKPEKQKPKSPDPEQLIREYGKGKLILTKPMLSRDKEIPEIEYDFTALTGMEYCDALDNDVMHANSMRISATQALNLFAAAAAKKSNTLDATDIREQISAQDAISAIKVATLFFQASNVGGDRRISK